MTKIEKYVFQRDGRHKLMKALTLFGVVGGTVVSVVLFIAALAH